MLFVLTNGVLFLCFSRQRCIAEAKADLTLGQGFAGRARPLGSNVICDFVQKVSILFLS